MNIRRRFLLCLQFGLLLLVAPLTAEAKRPPSGKLEIHYINIGQGGSTLIVGPNGTMILFDFGGVPAKKEIVNYLREHFDFQEGDGIEYAMISHGDKDHFSSYKTFVDAGFDVLKANYEPGTPKFRSTYMNDTWFTPAKKTKAGPFKPIPVGLRISLGDDAEAHVIAANGTVLGETKGQPVKNENDRSIALFVRYGKFQYLIDGDLGAGPETCTQHDTAQLDVQTRVARALVKEGLMTSEHGVDVLHIAHHGSESSTSAIYYKLMKPEVGLVSVGPVQGSFLHPREDVVDRVLLDTSKTTQIVRPGCVADVPPLYALLQTDIGAEGKSTTGRTSFSGSVVGDIQLTTDGKRDYTIRGTENVSQAGKFSAKAVRTKKEEFKDQGTLVWIFPFDEDRPRGKGGPGRP